MVDSVGLIGWARCAAFLSKELRRTLPQDVVITINDFAAVSDPHTEVRGGRATSLSNTHAFQKKRFAECAWRLLPASSTAWLLPEVFAEELITEPNTCVLCSLRCRRSSSGSIRASPTCACWTWSAMSRLPRGLGAAGPGRLGPGLCARPPRTLLHGFAPFGWSWRKLIIATVSLCSPGSTQWRVTTSSLHHSA